MMLCSLVQAALLKQCKCKLRWRYAWNCETRKHIWCMWEKNRMTWSSCSCASQSVHWLFGANGCIYMGFIQSAPTYTVNSHAGSGPLGFSIRTLQHADTVGSNHPTSWLVYNPLCLLTHGPCFYKKQNKKKQKKHTGCTDCQALKLGELCVMEIHLSIRLDHPLNGQKKQG